MTATLRPVATASPKPLALPSEPYAVSVKAAMTLSGLGSTTMFKLIKNGKLASVRVEGKRLILLSSLKRLLGISTDVAA